MLLPAQDQIHWRVDGAPRLVSIELVGGGAKLEATGPHLALATATGRWNVVFAAGRRVRPLPITVDVSQPALVSVAVDTAGQQVEQTMVQASAVVGGTRLDSVSPRDLRLRVRVRPSKAEGNVGIACRAGDNGDQYRWLWDVSEGELRLERVLGGQITMLGSAQAPAADGSWRVLELQVEGFRLAAFLDDVPRVAALDGALDGGQPMTLGSDRYDFRDVEVHEPARDVATTAVVAAPGRAHLQARTQMPGTSPFVVALRLDRPGPVWPVDDRGFEPALLLRPAEPLHLLATAGVVGHGGGLEAEFTWPRLPALSGQAALVGALVGTTDAQAIRCRLPWARIVF